MQPLKILHNWLQTHANEQHYLFATQDLRALFPALKDNAFKTLLTRAVSSQILNRVCRGLYVYMPACPRDGLLLFHAAARLRADSFTYISLETALSDAGVISQIPMNWITLMTSGRSNIIDCDAFGTIEWIHTTQAPQDIQSALTYDTLRGCWRASVPQALRDMKATRRNLDLIDWEVANEFIR